MSTMTVAPTHIARNSKVDDGVFATTEDLTAATAADAALLAASEATAAATYAPLQYGQAGTGSPEGVVTGNVGDRYVDTAATLGARVWYKATGAATNTGWLVAEGDTGLRLVDSLVAADYVLAAGGYIHLRRSGSMCHMGLFVTPATSISAGASKNVVEGIPAGFQFTLYQTMGLVYEYSTGKQGIARHDGSPAEMSWRFGSDTITNTTNNIRAEFTWMTNDPWPTSLPGTAV